MVLSWLGRYRLRAFLISSLWIIPVLGMALALAVAPLLRALDAATGLTLFGFGPEGARAVLAGLVASVFSFIVFLFSILMVTVQIASSNMSPRIISGVLATQPLRVSLGLMVFTFFYGLAVLGRIEAEVPQLLVAIVILSSLLSIVAFLYLIDYLTRRLRPVSVLAAVGATGARVIAAIYPQALASQAEGEAPLVERQAQRQVVRSRAGGVVLAFDVTGLSALAGGADCVIELMPQVGDFITAGDPLFRIHGGRAPLDEGRLLQHIALGAERTLEQDPAFAFRIVVDIAIKALSPAINDPTTAVLALDQLHHLLRNVGSRRLDTGAVRDANGRLRLLYRTPDWVDFVGLATVEIRHFGATSIQVVRRQRAMLESLIAALPPVRRPELEAELRRLQRGAEKAFHDPDDVARARSGDSLGLGGHPPRE
jgi:uncharacterized membrane protein